MILVTGASGFLGQHLLERLSQTSVPVRALYFTSKNLPQYPNVQWHSCDLSDVVALEEKMQGITHVYHCAAAVSFDARDKEKLIQKNVIITENIVNAALNAKIQKMVHVSSIAALGRKKEQPKTILINEDSIFDNDEHNSRYAFGKYLSEIEVWRGIAEGLNAVIVNPAIILGAGDWNKGSANLMQVVAKEFPWFTKGETAWVDVCDVAKAMLLLMGSAFSGERFILSQGNYAYKDIFSQMATALNKRPPHKFAQPWMTEIVWRLAVLKSRINGVKATITKETAHTAQQCYHYDNTKFLKAFPEFKYTPIETTIRKMATAYLKQH